MGLCYTTQVFLNDLAVYCQTIIITLKQKLTELPKKKKPSLLQFRTRGQTHLN